MIEKPKRPKKIPNQDNKQPQTIQELIRRYDLDNTKIYDFLDELVGSLKETQTVVSSTEPTGDNREKVWIQNTETEQKIYVKNDNNVYEEFIKDEKTLVKYAQVIDGFSIKSNRVLISNNVVNVTLQLEVEDTFEIGVETTKIATGLPGPKYGFQFSMSIFSESSIIPKRGFLSTGGDLYIWYSGATSLKQGAVLVFQFNYILE